jgi:hypothetical protein
VDAQYAKRFAAIGQSTLTGTTVSTLKIRADSNNIADRYIGDGLATGDDLDGEFMPQNTWVAKEWLFAGKRM